MTDQTISEEVEISSSYMSRKGQTYEELKTKAEDWYACNIKGYQFFNGIGEVPVYDIPSDYTEVETRFSKKEGHCHLCGHSIEFYHYIRNDVTKMVMQVGSECVQHNYGRVVRKTIKQFKDNETRQKAKLFLDAFILWSYTQKLYKAPKNQFEADYLIAEVFREKKKAEKLKASFDTTGIKKLENFMKKHKDFKQIPAVEQQLDFQIRNLKNLIYCIDNNVCNQKIQFGKFKDKFPSDLPDDYIAWARTEVLK
jgi:hypothetical protein